MTRQTSIDAYNDAENSGLLSKVRAEVLYIIAHHGPMTANEAFKLLARQHNEAQHLDRVSRAGQFTRLTELRDMNLIDELGTKVCTVTGRKVLLWGMSGRPIQRFERKHSRVKELEQEIARLESEIRRLRRLIPQQELFA